jgi:exopolyphosphatase/guanosine-5'-triphosphate,3'-diphosphate pyrophosphatase
LSNFLRFNFKEKVSSGSIERLGVIDIGSNSVRLVVFDGAARSPAYFYNEKVICSLGSNLSSDNVLNVDNKNKALAALKRFVLLSKAMHVTLIAVATAAVRNSKDGVAFCEEILQETGLNVTILTGEEEANLSAQGVLLGWPGADGLVCDLGGASLELAEISKGTVGKTISCPIGPLYLNQFYLDQKLQRDFVNSELRKSKKLFSRKYTNIYLVGGSWRSIARTQMEMTDYPLKVLHEYQMRIAEIKGTLTWIMRASLKDLEAKSPSSSSRLRLLPSSAIILNELIDCFQPKKLAVSSYGIREGLLHSAMNKKLREKDPLLEACRHMEASAARIPGFGLTLFNFIMPLFETSEKNFVRLIKAACFLHDVSWRAHPDYRAEVCFDNATRANLGGIDHQGRAFLAIALLYRYKSPKKNEIFSKIFSILDKKDRRKAEILGKAMRFGAMLSGSTADSMGKLELDNSKKLLKLKISEKNKDLFGKVVQQRFASVALRMSYEPIIIWT